MAFSAWEAIVSEPAAADPAAAPDGLTAAGSERGPEFVRVRLAAATNTKSASPAASSDAIRRITDPS